MESKGRRAQLLRLSQPPAAPWVLPRSHQRSTSGLRLEFSVCLLLPSTRGHQSPVPLSPSLPAAAASTETLAAEESRASCFLDFVLLGLGWFQASSPLSSVCSGEWVLSPVKVAACHRRPEVILGPGYSVSLTSGHSLVPASQIQPPSLGKTLSPCLALPLLP